jgi:hypothetical protein
MRSRWCTRLDLPVYGHGEVIISCIVHAPGTEVGRRRCVVAGQTPWETRDKRGERAAKSTRRVQHILRRRGRRYQQRKFCGFHITGPAARPGTASSVDSYRSLRAAGHSKFGGLIPVPQSGRAQQVRWFHYRAASTITSQRTKRLTVMTAPATVSEAQVAAYTMCVCGST